MIDFIKDKIPDVDSPWIKLWQERKQRESDIPDKTQTDIPDKTQTDIPEKTQTDIVSDSSNVPQSDTRVRNKRKLSVNIDLLDVNIEMKDVSRKRGGRKFQKKKKVYKYKPTT